MLLDGRICPRRKNQVIGSTRTGNVKETNGFLFVGLFFHQAIHLQTEILMRLTKRLLQLDECPELRVQYRRSGMWRTFAIDIRDNHNGEFEPLRLVDRHQSNDFARFRQRRRKFFVRFFKNRRL